MGNEKRCCTLWLGRHSPIEERPFHCPPTSSDQQRNIRHSHTAWGFSLAPQCTWPWPSQFQFLDENYISESHVHVLSPSCRCLTLKVDPRNQLESSLLYSYKTTGRFWLSRPRRSNIKSSWDENVAAEKLRPTRNALCATLKNGHCEYSQSGRSRYHRVLAIDFERHWPIRTWSDVLSLSV